MVRHARCSLIVIPRVPEGRRAPVGRRARGAERTMMPATALSRTSLCSTMVSTLSQQTVIPSSALWATTLSRTTLRSTADHDPFVVVVYAIAGDEVPSRGGEFDAAAAAVAVDVVVHDPVVVVEPLSAAQLDARAAVVAHRQVAEGAVGHPVCLPAREEAAAELLDRAVLDRRDRRSRRRRCRRPRTARRCSPWPA